MIIAKKKKKPKHQTVFRAVNSDCAYLCTDSVRIFTLIGTAEVSPGHPSGERVCALSESQLGVMQCGVAGCWAWWAFSHPFTGMSALKKPREKFSALLPSLSATGEIKGEISRVKYKNWLWVRRQNNTVTKTFLINQLFGTSRERITYLTLPACFPHLIC